MPNTPAAHLRDHLAKAKRLWFPLYERVLFERHKITAKEAPTIGLWPKLEDPPDVSLRYAPVDMSQNGSERERVADD